MAPESTHHKGIVPQSLAGLRLDQALAEMFPDYSRARLQDWIDRGRVTLDGRRPRRRDRVTGGEEVHVEAASEPRDEALPEPMPLAIVFEDDDVIVLEKPAGLVVHPGAGHRTGTLVSGLLHHRPALAALPRAGLVHRLDKDTSGLLVAAASEQAHTHLVRAMQAREVRREYVTVVCGTVTAGGTVDAPVGRHPTERVRMAVTGRGRPAVTHYRLVRRFRGHTLLTVTLETGRMHQIRVHMAHIGHRVVGDPLYGGRLAIPRGATPALADALRALHRQALHACRLAFAHPVSGEALSFESALPADLRALVDVLADDLDTVERGT